MNCSVRNFVTPRGGKVLPLSGKVIGGAANPCRQGVFKRNFAVSDRFFISGTSLALKR